MCPINDQCTRDTQAWLFRHFPLTGALEKSVRQPGNHEENVCANHLMGGKTEDHAGKEDTHKKHRGMKRNKKAVTRSCRGEFHDCLLRAIVQTTIVLHTHARNKLEFEVPRFRPQRNGIYTPVFYTKYMLFSKTRPRGFELERGRGCEWAAGCVYAFGHIHNCCLRNIQADQVASQASHVPWVRNSRYYAEWVVTVVQHSAKSPHGRQIKRYITCEGEIAPAEDASFHVVHVVRESNISGAVTVFLETCPRNRPDLQCQNRTAVVLLLVKPCGRNNFGNVCTRELWRFVFLREACQNSSGPSKLKTSELARVNNTPAPSDR